MSAISDLYELLLSCATCQVRLMISSSLSLLVMLCDSCATSSVSSASVSFLCASSRHDVIDTQAVYL